MIDKTKVQKVCSEAIAKFGCIDPDICSRYVLRTLYPDAVATWRLQPETQSQHALLRQIRPVVKAELAAHEEYQRRLRLAIPATVQALRENRADPLMERVAALVFRALHADLVQPEIALPVGFREAKMRVICAAVLTYFQGESRCALN
jgi:hypothetical protein